MNASEFSRVFCERPHSFAWFLGAGASRNANLPTAEDIITDLKRRYYCSEENQTFTTKDMQNSAVRANVEGFLKSRGLPDRWSQDEYTTYFKTIFGSDKERQRKYIRGMLAESKVQLAVGNRVFGALLASKLTRVAFTTNFDTVIEKSVAEISGSSLSAYHLEGARGANAALNNEEYPFYCKLHGDFRHDSIKNLEIDLASQNDELSHCFMNAASRFGFVVAGYSGRDSSVMKLFHDALESQNPFPHGIYWMQVKGSGTPEPITKLIAAAKKRNVQAQLVEIETFDSIMLRLWRNLPTPPEEFDKKVRKGSAKAVSIPLPSSNGTKPVLRYNALPILKIPHKCWTVDLKTKPTWNTVAPILREAQHNIVATVDDHLMVWGMPDEVETLFGHDFLGLSELEFEPDWRKTGRLHIKKFLEEALGRAFVSNRPLLMRVRNFGVVLIVDQMAQDVGIFEPLHRIVGKTSGTIPGATIPASEEREAVHRIDYAESVQCSLAWNGDRLWLLLKPDVWIWPPHARRHVTQWLDERKADRRNDKLAAILNAWISVLTDGAGRAESVTLSSYDGELGANNPEFTFSSRTGYSNKQAI